ncbi:RidA family protein [Sinorhizobium meliloti]|nr:RidA family protein [Sinorhizobium meliloti]
MQTAATGMVLTASSSALAEEPKSNSESLNGAPQGVWPGGVEKPLMPYTPAIKAAGWLFIAGQLASDFETGVAPQARSDSDSPAEHLSLQSRFVMSNVEKTVAAAGLDMGRDTARIWQWMTSPNPTMDEFESGVNWPGIETNAHFSQRDKFLKSPGPSSTAMGVKALMVKDTLLEVDLICIDDGGQNVSFDATAQKPGSAPSVRRGDWVFLSSETWARDTKGKSTEQQANEIFEHLNSLATAAGSSLSRAVKAEVYIGHPSEYSGMEIAWKRWFPDNPPARVVVPYMGMTGGRGRRVEVALTLLANDSTKIIETIYTDKAPKPFSHEPQAVKVGNLLFFSQQMPAGSNGDLAPGMARHPSFPFYGLPAREQMRYMLKNVAAICEAAGSSLENVIRRVCFHDHGENFAEAMDEWAAHFPNLKPVSTSIVLGGPLVVSGAHTLLDITAYVP